MTREELEILYKETILPESKEPYHFKENELVSDHIKAYNPMCGDKFHLHLDVQESRIVDAYFSGIGCAISRASTSVLIRSIEGLTKKEAYELCRGFFAAIESGQIRSFEENEKIKTLLELRNFEGRIDCIQLSWKALEDYLSND